MFVFFLFWSSFLSLDILSGSIKFNNLVSGQIRVRVWNVRISPSGRDGLGRGLGKD
jgi:hypothetical protein